MQPFVMVSSVGLIRRHESPTDGDSGPKLPKQPSIRILGNRDTTSGGTMLSIG
jgi:hypothetical protein